MTSVRSILAFAAALAVAPVGAADHSGAVSMAELQAKAVRAAVERVRSAVVQLQPIGGIDPLGGGGLSTPTTGLLISSDGTILTSSFGLDPRPESILVIYDDGSRSTGRLLAIDHNRRLALVAASRGPRTPPPELARAESPVVGATAIAVGRTHRPDEPNLAVGIVSALNRLYGRAVQTDAAISPANYGGPLIDLRGRVIGLLTPLAPNGPMAADGGGQQSGVGWYDSGIGFAVPLAAIDARLETLRRGEGIHAGLAGITFAKGSPYSAPARLRDVHPGGPADEAGLRAGDVLIAVNGQPVATPSDYRFAADAADAGQSLSIEARRGEETFTATVTLTDELRPAEVETAP